MDAARRLLVARGWNGTRPLAVLAPGAAYGTAKRWIPSHVAKLAGELVRGRGVTCALVGSRSDRVTTAATLALMDPDARAHAVDLAGETTLADLAGLFAMADVCVSNDSGAMHVAAAVGAPVVAIFGPTREYETRPLASARGRTEVLTHPVWCRPCMLRECPIDHRCMRRITPQRVYTAVDTLLGRAAR
jgi:heptosyltransferase-2